ncbi:MAG: hypothetical protein RMJ38_00430 [candidate division WOR-3 bacterium]|nr:hypothetical protein [candidate division WOR-3 bacterium]MDW8149901.1 hypothetical protein [candidate division WOR-3 bacterium]
MRFLSFIFILISCLNAQTKVDEKELNEFIRKNFKDYMLFPKAIIKKHYKNIILVDFASAGATTNYRAIIIKDKHFQVGKLEKDGLKMDGVFVVGGGGSGRYYLDVDLNKSYLKIYEYSIYGKREDYCKVEVYKLEKNVFRYNKEMSEIEEKTYCKKILSK